MTQEILCVVRLVAAAAGLAYLSVEDIRKKSIPIWPIIAMGAVGAVLSAIGGEWTSWTVALRFLPGALCLLLGLLSREAVGYGDGLVILCLGAYLSLAELMQLCLAAVTLAGVVALLLMLIMRKGRKTAMPLIPFLLAGYGLALLL
ncbi:MAG: prepilin peptidase [Clostridiales bacterium]|nr:prepilin peptidase [Clostridiales bacterium]